MVKNKFAGGLLFVIFFTCHYVYATTRNTYTVIDARHYHRVVDTSRSKVKHLLELLKPYRQLSYNDQIKFIVQQLLDTPYIYVGAMGEGDWEPNSPIYKPGATHIQQDPVYRLDGFDCQTFVQVTIALLHARDIDTFDQTILKIAYGSANHVDRIVNFYNRNHFVDADLNPINQKNRFFVDVTEQGDLADYAHTTSALVNRSRWLAFKRHLSNETVRVLDKSQGELMVKHLNTQHTKTLFSNLHPQNVIIHYLPKGELVIKNPEGGYRPNQFLFNKIPTPSVVEIIYNHKNWSLGGKNIKDIIGTELNVAHFGILYRQTFREGELIYHKIACNYGIHNQKICTVKPIYCKQQKCEELMFAHATNGYPHGFYWQRNGKGEYSCTANRPVRQPIQYCNRVERHPLFEYLTEKQYGSHWYLQNTTFLGIHIEKLT